MLFSVNPYLWSIDDLSLDDILEIADILTHKTPEVRPIFECVKVYAKLDEHSQVKYARHKSDFCGVGKQDIIDRMKDPIVSDVVAEALQEIEDSIIDVWPFRPGSATWCLFEILDPAIRIAGWENTHGIIVREAVRIDIKGNKSHSSLTNRMFARMREDIKRSDSLQFIFDPVLHLRNVSGTGVYTSLRADVVAISAAEGGTQLPVCELSEVAQGFLMNSLKKFADHLFLANSTSLLHESLEESEALLDHFPGINVKIKDLTFRLSGSFLNRKEKLVLAESSPKSSFPLPLPWRS